MIQTQSQSAGDTPRRGTTVGVPEPVASGPTAPQDAAAVRASFAALDATTLQRMAAESQRLLEEDGVTYNPGARDGARDRRWRLDPLPLVLSPEEWAPIEAGVIQRAELLNLVLADLYGPRDLLRTGVLPPEVVFAHPGFLRPLDGVRIPGFQQLTVCATDLVQDATGAWRPLSDRTQVPSGAAYALQNRSVIARLAREVHRVAAVERLAPYVRSLRGAMQRATPSDVTEPRMALLTAGASAETAFEHGHLAAELGIPVVEGADLSVRDGRVWLRAIGGAPAAIDVLLRRVDAWWCDPLELRGDSQLGTPGMVEAARRGGVSLVNGLGSGVLENTALQAFLPQIAAALLGQELKLTPPRTLWCGDAAQRDEVLARFDELVVKPMGRIGPSEPVLVSRLSRAERTELRERVLAHPHRWVGQEHVDGMLTPSVSPSGHLVQARTVLRTFAVARGDSYTTMRGGLTRVSDAERLAVATTVGAWSKDTWVLGGEREVPEGFWLLDGPKVAADAPETVVSARAVENLLWFGRYAERADALVRLLRTVDDRRSEVGGGTPALRATIDRLLVAVTRATRTGPGFDVATTRRPDPDTELRSLVVDADRAGSLAFDVRRLSRAAHAVRDQLSGDTWPVLTMLERALLGDGDREPEIVSGRYGPPHGRAALAGVLTSLLALQGLGAESLVRDPSWRFLEAGRRLERGQQLLGLLRATVVEPADEAVQSLVLESVLIASESVITYRRRYRSRAQLATVLDLLLLDPTNPRSLQWQLERLAEELPLLPGHAEADGRLSPVEEVVHATASALRTADLEAVAHAPDELELLLSHLDTMLQRAGTELSRVMFAPVPSSRPLVEERVGTAGDALLA